MIFLKFLFLSWLLLPSSVSYSGSQIVWNNVVLSVVSVCSDLSTIISLTYNNITSSLLNSVSQFSDLVLEFFINIQHHFSLGQKNMILFINDIFNHILDLINCFKNMVQTIILYFWDFLNFLVDSFLEFFEDPINFMFKTFIQLKNFARETSEKILKFYQFNEKYPVYFSQKFKIISFSCKNSLNKIWKWILENSESIYHNIFIFHSYLQIVFMDFRTNILQILQNISSSLHCMIEKYFDVFIEFVSPFSSSLQTSTAEMGSICLNYYNCSVTIIFKYLILLYETIVNLVIMVVKIFANHVQHNPKQPRLFSQVFKNWIKNYVKK